MTKKTKISEEESNEFRDHVKNVKPLPQSKKVMLSKPSINSKRKPTTEKLPKWELEPIITIHEPVSAEEVLSFSRGGLQGKTWRQLKQGQFTIDAELDLHGLNSTQAFNALTSFITYCQSQHYRCVSIIHGKGQRHSTAPPVLKNKVNVWLRDMPEVIAFHSAKRLHGGMGAIYVLLKLSKS